MLRYNTEARTTEEPARNFAEASKTTTQTLTTTILNGHSFDLDGVIVRDSLPLGDAEAKIKVALQKPTGLAQAKDGEEIAVALDGEVGGAKVRWSAIVDGKGGEKDGVYEWVCKIPAGKKVELEVEWDVKAPAGLRWEEK